MRCSSALVLGTLAVGQAAAGNLRHASFHARRNAKAAGIEAIDVKRLAQDAEVYAKINWSTFNWDSLLETVFPKTSAAPTPTPEVNVKVTPAAVAIPTSTPEQKPSATPSSTSQAAKPSETAKSDPIGDALQGLMAGVDAFISRMGVKKPVNAESPNDSIWLGTSGTAPLRVKHINKSGKEMKLFCWVHTDDFTGMTINVTPPKIAVNLPANGEAVVTSHPEKKPFACAPATSVTALVNGLVKNTWFEGQAAGIFGTFDISKNPNMNGTPISSQGSLCKSDMNTCVFECTESNDSCTTGYTLRNCEESNGGHQGFDKAMNGVGGGCKMSPQEEITVNYG